MKRQTGYYDTALMGGEKVSAFIPYPLPPDPPLDLGSALRNRIDEAYLELGRLDSVSVMVPDRDLFLYMYVRKEAVLSSRIEGTQSSLSDLLMYEADGRPGVPLDDVQEVSCYVDALNHGIRRMREGFPLCNRLLREVHTRLLGSGRGADKNPGEFRRSQNWLGGTRPGNARFVPPPSREVPGCMGELERYLNRPDADENVLVRAALAHVQFETIHPFLDGNGRLGRMLITLLLTAGGVMRSPLLYLSLYFKTHRQEYYSLLNRVRTEGAWETWIDFFTEAVTRVARQAAEAAVEMSALIARDRGRLEAGTNIPVSAVKLHRALTEKPVLTIGRACTLTGLVPNTVRAAFDVLVRSGIAAEVTGKKRNMVFTYPAYMEILNRED